MSTSQYLAIIRGELPCDCTCRETDYLPRQVFRHDNGWDLTIQYGTAAYRNDILGHRVCYLHDAHAALKPEPEWLTDAHRGHTLSGLKPYGPSPIGDVKQTDRIQRLAGIRDRIYKGDLRGWTMLGPAGSSKSTFASAVCRDLLTLRWSRERLNVLLNGHGPDIDGQVQRQALYTERTRSHGIWRVKVRQWLAEMHAWEIRSLASPEDSGDPDVVKKMRYEKGMFGHKPIVWLEEIDRFPNTEARLNHLFGLLDYINENGGSVIVTTNLSAEELTGRFDAAIVRRMMGSPGEHVTYELWNMHQDATSGRTGKRP